MIFLRVSLGRMISSMTWAVQVRPVSKRARAAGRGPGPAAAEVAGRSGPEGAHRGGGRKSGRSCQLYDVDGVCMDLRVVGDRVYALSAPKPDARNGSRLLVFQWLKKHRALELLDTIPLPGRPTLLAG